MSDSFEQVEEKKMNFPLVMTVYLLGIFMGHLIRVSLHLQEQSFRNRVAVACAVGSRQEK